MNLKNIYILKSWIMSAWNALEVLFTTTTADHTKSCIQYLRPCHHIICGVHSKHVINIRWMMQQGGQMVDWFSYSAHAREKILTHGPCFQATLHLTATLWAHQRCTTIHRVRGTLMKLPPLTGALLWCFTSSFSLVVQNLRSKHFWHHLKTQRMRRAGWRCAGDSTAKSWPPNPTS